MQIRLDMKFGLSPLQRGEHDRNSLTSPMHRNEVKFVLSCEGYLRPVIGNVMRLSVVGEAVVVESLSGN